MLSLQYKCALSVSILFFTVSCVRNPIVNNIQNEKVSSYLLRANQWKLVSFPINDVPIDKIIPADVKVAYWDESKEAIEIWEYYLQKNQIDSIRTGHSYWLKCSTEVSFSLEAFEEYGEDSISILLRKGIHGWNMIGNPYPFSIFAPKCNLIFLEFNNETESVFNAALSKKTSSHELYEILNTAEWDTVTMFEPWCGYFVRIDTDSVLLTIKKQF